MDILHILLVVTGTGKYPNIDLKTGLWLSEFTHIYHGAKEKGYSITCLLYTSDAADEL